ncbi:FumA C-terminus/TtdB family hydratase beta subunit [Thermococcus sp. MV11]|uniref:FumA C-terminus/TtdB family hydratase beta subunit n=1 Tax=Thermococcus sp. MV11 TaxID=1638267 RepID=UPI00142FCB2F|nr:FumA C-terminus/TtdB family hydratase beta subunit [Thermococcus sp. MV11]NJE04019.1 fumarate hydratase [Thermococcus sp. MV11]
MAVKLETPLGEEDVLKLRAGDIVLLSGTIYTARDSAHRRILSLPREELPFEPEGAVIYHCGPVVRKRGESYKVVSAGPTTSARMNLYLEGILGLGVRGIIGKGGMEVGPFKGRAVYFAFTGGAGSLAARSIKRVKAVHWLDLGIPEALWVLEVEDFPLIVAIDAHGGSLYR